MVIHGSISIVRYVIYDIFLTQEVSERCLSIIQPSFTEVQSLKGTFCLLAFNVIYAGLFAAGMTEFEWKTEFITFYLAPMLGWGRYQKFEYGCCIAFNDRSFNVRSYVITVLIGVLFLPFCKFRILK